MYILYGAELVLYLFSVQKITRSRHGRPKSSMDQFFLYFSTALLILITIFISTSAVFGEEMWIVNAGFPGGQAAYLAQYASVWYQTMGTTAFVVLNLMADALMIYRLHMLWRNKWLVVFPSFLWIASLVLGILQLWLSGVPGGTIFSGITVDIDLGYFCSTVGLNVFVTVLILMRLLRITKHTRATLGNGASKVYTNLASIFIESALPYALSGVAFLVSYGIGSQISVLFQDIWVMWTCLSPQMIILRVVGGHGWTKEQITKSLGAPLSFSADTGGSITVGEYGAAVVELGSISGMNTSSPGLYAKS